MFKKFILLFLVWIGLTNSLDIQELIVGAAVAIAVTYWFTKRTQETELNLKELTFKYLKFIPVFLKNLVESNIAVAKIVLNPKLPINTGIVKLKTGLTNDYDKLILANAITLTPGTITVELRGEDLYIHVLNLESMDREVLQQEIVEPLESGLR